MMRAHQIMTRSVVSVTPDTTVREAATLMLERHISGLPVIDADGKLVGIVSEGDFIRRSEIGTQHKRGGWLSYLLSLRSHSVDFVHENGRKISEVMTPDPFTVTEDTSLEDIVALMERKHVKRLPVVRNEKLVGIVSRSNLMQAVASLAHDIPDPTADDDHIRKRIIESLEKSDWCPIGLSVVVRDGIVHLSGIITQASVRQAIIVTAENVAGVRKVHDHLRWVEPMSGIYLDSPEDIEMAKAD